MRDIALLIIFIAAVPFILKRPSIGVIMWVWLSVMNPHRLTYNFAYSLQFAAATAGLTMIALLITKDERRLPLTPPTILLALFMLWMCLTSLVPFHPGSGYEMWSRVMKIFLMTFVAIIAIQNKKQIHWLVWIIVFSLAFYGVKGGIFTLVHRGSYLVWGPEGSFIEGNNEVALAFVMTIPLMRYVQLGLKKQWQRRGMTAAMLLCALAAVGSHSRGALLAIAGMGLFLWWKSRNKFGMGIALFAVALGMLAFMPDDWMARMQTIQTYDEDSSAMGRINAWWMAFHMASDRLFGGGFDIYDFDTFARYAPNPLDVHAAHSIYFQVLGEHGFIGLFLFMGIGAFTWAAASDAKRKARGITDMEWIGSLMDMVKVSMVGYAVGGAFLSLAYFDVPYYLLVIVVATRELAIAASKAVVQHKPQGFVRSERFGVVPTQEGTPIVEGAPPRPRPDEWRGRVRHT
ncbi:MAG: putative O-glycosylation ligase, exosortase A system-associated [Burkholderiaceae bacterium]